MTLLETCAVLALASIGAVGALAGAKPLACALRVSAARNVLISALFEARRQAYATETSVAVETSAGDGFVTLAPPGVQRALGAGVVLTAVPADGDVLFRASGLADNATLTLACDESRASVVVNQRGVVR